MNTRIERINQAFAHKVPDRTPLFEIFQPFQPIHWDICGKNVATHQALCWDAMSEGISWEELAEASAKAQFAICKFFGLDMVRLTGAPASPNYERPVKTGRTSWTLKGIKYVENPRTKMVEYADPAEAMSYSNRVTEEDLIKQIESWDGSAAEVNVNGFAIYDKVRKLADQEGIDWVYMGEIGAGTGVAFYPPFMLMWMLAEPELYSRWLEMKKVTALKQTEVMLHRGMKVIALGGDVSCDKGPFISPQLYREFILPVIREHVEIVHKHGGRAVYTSDGNHWDIKDDFFFNSNIDGYKEVDKAAGMTMEKLIESGIDKKVCIIGNIDARHILCHGTKEEVRNEVINCLKLGQQSPGGHILHASHSVHEDVIPENYYTVVNTYRDFFGMEPIR
jgi:hypothetical protein